MQQQNVVEEETLSLGNRGRGANMAFLCSSMAHHKEGLACCCADTSFSNAIVLHGAHVIEM